VEGHHSSLTSGQPLHHTPFETLTKDVFQVLQAYLPLRDLVVVSGLSKHMRALCAQDGLWHQRALMDSQTWLPYSPVITTSDPGRSWKDTYIRNYRGWKQRVISWDASSVGGNVVITDQGKTALFENSYGTCKSLQVYVLLLECFSLVSLCSHLVVQGLRKGCIILRARYISALSMEEWVLFRLRRLYQRLGEELGSRPRVPTSGSLDLEFGVVPGGTLSV
jgi:hypothetical protein